MRGLWGEGGEGEEGGGAGLGDGSGGWVGRWSGGGKGKRERERTEDVTLVVLPSLTDDFEGTLSIRDIGTACIGRIPALVPSSQAVPARIIRLAAQPAEIGVLVEDSDDVVKRDIEVRSHAVLGSLIIADQQRRSEGTQRVARPVVRLEGQGAGPGVVAVPVDAVGGGEDVAGADEGGGAGGVRVRPFARDGVGVGG